MSLENEDPRSPRKGSDKFDDVLKKSKISYSREFLCSLSSLDICKKLPSGFDESLLCEFEESAQDQPRNPGSLPLQGFRRNEYGSSPPTRGGSLNYSRGVYGKWESRSSGRGNQDSDSQSDRDSDSGRRYGHQSGRFRPTTEQDGLLGSGSFPRPSGYAAGISAPKVRANEPYHPPRPYKAVPYSRKDTDAYNDETFGSLECNNEDRAEEERKRRASFELMRKEQQKVLQEKQTLNMEKHKSSDIFSISEALGDKKDEKEPFVRNNELEISAVNSTLDNALEKSFLPSHSSASRPVVPPGFKKGVLEKSSGLKSPIHYPLVKEKPVMSESLLDGEVNFVNFVQNGNNDGLERQLSKEISLVDGQLVQNTPLLEKRENVNLRVSLDMHIRKPDMADQSSRLDSRGTLDDPEITEHDAYIMEDKTVGNSNKSYSTSIMEKISGATLSMNNNGGSGLAEHYDNSKPDDTRIPNSDRPSKFAQWFYDEEAKPADDSISRGKPNDLLSLIVSGDKVKHQFSDSEAAAEHFPLDLFSNSIEQSKKLSLDLPSTAGEACFNNKGEIIPSVLTCEDLEQSILTEYCVKTTNVEPLLEGWSKSDPNAEQSKGEQIDNHASLHLLSLLQKGTDLTNVTINSSFNINSTNEPSRQHSVGPTAVNEPKGKQNSKNIPIAGETLILETLFGSPFMEELQSVEAPVSIQRGSTGPDNDISISSIDENLLSVPDPRNNGISKFMLAHNSIDRLNFSSSGPIDIMAQVRPLYNHLESDLARMSPQMKFLRQEPMISRDSRDNHQCPPNAIQRPFHNPNVGIAGFDVRSHHPMLNQMQMPSNHAPRMGPDFLIGGPISLHGNQATGFLQEMNQMQGFPFEARQANIGNRGSPIPAPGISSGGPPEVFQRLIEMELCANPDHSRPFPPPIHNQGIYGRELDMSLRYR